MLFDYDFESKVMSVPADVTTLYVQDIINDIREMEATEVGIAYNRIAAASGKEDLGEGVSTGITVTLLEGWQLKFPEGNYIAKIVGGNLIGGIGGNPIAYTAGVQTLLVQSAASTVVTRSTGSGLSEEQDSVLRQALAAANGAKSEASKARKMQTNKAVISGDGRTVSIYEDDGATLLHTYQISADKLSRVPS